MYSYTIYKHSMDRLNALYGASLIEALDLTAKADVTYVVSTQVMI